MIIIGVRSAASYSHGSDRDRRLTEHGHFQAQTLKMKLDALGHTPNVAIVSPAVRSHLTASEAMRGYFPIPCEIWELYSHSDRDKNDTLVGMFSIKKEGSLRDYTSRFKDDAKIILEMAHRAASKIQCHLAYREKMGYHTTGVLICGHAAILPAVMYELFPSPFFLNVSMHHGEAFIVDTCQGDHDNVTRIPPNGAVQGYIPLIPVEEHH